MKKIYIIIALISILVCSGCEEWLDVQPTRSLSPEVAIQDKEGLMNGITGCYDAMQSASYYGRTMFNMGELASDNAYNGGTIKEYGQFNNNSILADNATIEGTWSSIYTAINRANAILAEIDRLEDLSDEEKDAFRAELYFLRALHYFNLLRTYGDVPAKFEATTDLTTINTPLSSVSEILSLINTDLEFAEGKITGTSKTRATNWALLALQSKIALFSGDYTAAISKATEVIDDGPFMMEEAYENLFLQEISDESIFEVDFTETDKNRLAEYYLPNQLTGRYEVAPEEGLISAFGAEDSARLNATIKYVEGTPYAGKYTDISLGGDNVYVFRLAEMYLIRAEANAMLGQNLNAVQDDINEVRSRADLANTGAGTYEELKLAIEEERRFEFAFEGHRWYDLVRTGRAISVLPNISTADQYLFPIPLAETTANEAID